MQWHREFSSGSESIFVNKETRKWYIENESGDLWGQVSYDIQNKGSSAIASFGFESEGFLENIEKFDVQYSVGRGSGAEVRVVNSEPQQYKLETTLHRIQGISVTYWGWRVTFDRPLKPKESLSFSWTYLAKGSEVRAFQEKGTNAGIRVQRPTKAVEVILIAPPRTVIELLSVSALDDTGSELKGVRIGRNTRPQLQLEGSTLVWSIPYPSRSLDYSFVYKLRRVDNLAT